MEAWTTVNMMRDSWFHPTLNLDNVDENCGDIDYIVGDGRQMNCELAMSNNFAFGGINTSLIFKQI
jgi:3-oxoacyl-[acyl-carrier-protein] synthase II